MKTKNNKTNKTNIHNKNNKNNKNTNTLTPKTQEKKEVSKSTSVSFVNVSFVMSPATLKDHIRCFLFDKPQKTIKEITTGLQKLKITNVTIPKVTTTLHRNKHIFMVTSKTGNENIYSLVPSEVQRLNSLIEQRKKTEIEKRKRELSNELIRKREEKTQADLLASIKQLIHEKEGRL